MEWNKTLNKVNKIFNKFGIYDWIIVAIVLSTGLKISMMPIHSDFKPYIISYIDFPHRTSTIPYESLCILIFGVGSLITIIFWVMYESSLTPMLSKCLAAYYFSISLTIFVESGLKYYVGRPRPDTLSNCQININSSVSFQQCAQVLSSYSASDQFLSFPSGHAAESMASCVFISLLLTKIFYSSNEDSKTNSKENYNSSIQSIKGVQYNQVNSNNENSFVVQIKNDNPDSVFSTSLLVFLQILPIGFAIYVAFSRIWDRMHHTDDVIMGMILGALVSKITFNAFDFGTKNDFNEDLPASNV